MTIATVANSLRQVMNQTSVGKIATYLDAINIGDVVAGMPRVLRRCNPNTAAVNPYIRAGQSVAESTTGANPAVSPGANLFGQLPDDAKASVILRATAMTGAGTLGELTVNTPAQNVTAFGTAGTGPIAGNIGLSPSGDIVTNTADAWTSLDVWYLPEQVDVFELVLVPVAGVVTLPNLCNLPGTFVANTVPAAVLLMEAEILTGTATGKVALLSPSNAVTATTLQANLNLAKTQVLFRVADAPTSVRLKLGLCRTCNVGVGVNLNQLLEAIAAV